MEEMIAAIVRGLVDDKENINVTKDEPDEEGVIVYHINVAPDDMGRVIGKQGRIAKAIRTIARAAANRLDQKVAVEID
ncbi:MAG: KH domain-containing protein [Oscillospiraceae bacterium]